MANARLARRRKCLAIFGKGGHATVGLEVATHSGWEVCTTLVHAGFEGSESAHPAFGNLVSLGQPADINHLEQHNWAIFVGSNIARVSALADIRRFDPRASFPNFIAPGVVLPDSCFLGEGNLICKGATIGPEANIGNFCIINTASTIEHHSAIGDFSHVAPGAIVLGSASIGHGCLLGANSIVDSRVKLPNNSTVGALSFLKDSPSDSGVFVGQPARRK